MTKEKIKDAIYTRRYIYNFHYHLIWVTKYRNQTFTTEVLSNEMKAILQQVADDNDIVIEKMEVMPDHINMLPIFFYRIIQKYDVANIGAVIFGRRVTI